MNRGPYSTLAAVYEWLVPDALLEPEGAVDAFAGVVDRLAPGARVLDCAAGTGQLAVGLALRGFDVVASDASAAMVERTRQLAVRRRVEVPTVVCGWEGLGGFGGAASRRAGHPRRGAPGLGGPRVADRRALGGPPPPRGRRGPARRGWPRDARRRCARHVGRDLAYRASDVLAVRARELARDLRASGLAREDDTYDPDAERYLVTARAD